MRSGHASVLKICGNIYAVGRCTVKIPRGNDISASLSLSRSVALRKRFAESQIVSANTLCADPRER